ncbi:MAG: hypothetical protein Q7R93_05460 [bacterium]|nr:hypothetical protein [bacterium]
MSFYMPDGKIEVEVFGQKRITQRVINDINDLLIMQHSKADLTNEKELREHLKRSKLAVAWQDDDRVVAMGVLCRTYPISHWFGGIHNLIFRPSYDVRSICPRIVNLLIKDIYDLEYVDARVAKKDEDIIAVLQSIGFKEKIKSLYRLRFKR